MTSYTNLGMQSSFREFIGMLTPRQRQYFRFPGPGHPCYSKDTLAALEEQARWLVDEGVDLIVAETFDRLDEVLVAVDVSKALDVPVVATMSWREIDEISTDGFPIDVCALRLREAGADVVGFNCRQEPETALAVGGHSDRPAVVE